MNYLSVCSGIEAASCAWHPLGWNAVAFSEIEPFPAAVLKHHFPAVPNWGDMTRFKDWPDADVDVLVGGTPCQSFSFAGLRKGLDDPRGNLMLTFGAISDRYRPRWLVWENVPGVLSSNGGRDFGSFLGLLGVLGYGFAYRVLDAQYAGLAQRRKRVFVVGCLGDWRSAAAVLFERHSLSGHPAPSREAGQRVAVPVTAGAPGGSGYRNDADTADNLIARCVTVGEGKRQGYETTTLVTHALTVVGNPPAIAFQTRGSNLDVGEVSGTLGTNCDAASGGAPMVAAFDARQSDVIQYGDMSVPLDTDGHTIGVRQASAVRRLTPRECERLQGFPDDWTNVQYKGKPAADGPRYKAIGNSMAVPCMGWIGRRIDMVEAI